MISMLDLMKKFKDFDIFDQDSKYQDTYETQHVFNSHCYNKIKFISEEPEEYDKSEMIKAIKEAVEYLDAFENEYLEPILEELDLHRSYQLLLEDENER